MDEKIRINKYLSEAGFCSRREADVLVSSGRVMADGHLAVSGEKISLDAVVQVDGKEVKKNEKKVLLLFYKPRGIVCSTKKQRQETTVTEYLNYPLRIYPVGRLDRESEGLLLLTNQGDLVNKIMRAGNYHEKEYLVTVDKPIEDSFVKKMASGVPILDTVTRPCFVEKTGKNSFRIILTQGLNRQIRRMCEYLGYQVLTLKRVRIMELTLGGLKPGEYREITEKEWEKLSSGLEQSSSLPVRVREPHQMVSASGQEHRQSNQVFGGASGQKYRRSGSVSGASGQPSKPVARPFGVEAKKSAGKSYQRKAGGHHGKFHTANERTGRNPEPGRKGVLSGGQGNHEQPGVRQSVRSAGSSGKRNRHRSHK